MTHLTETQRMEIIILIGCGDKTKTRGISLKTCLLSTSWGMAIRTFNSIILSSQ
jgi:hypothetical protein